MPSAHRQECCSTVIVTPPGPGSLYRQARTREGLTLADVFLPATDVPAGDFYFYNPDDSTCYVCLASDGTTDTPGTVLDGWEAIDTAGEETRLCGAIFVQARTCAGVVANLWAQKDLLPTFPAVYSSDGLCYIFDANSATARGAAPGPVISGTYLGVNCFDASCGTAFLKARRCDDNTYAELWHRRSTLPTLPAVYQHGGVCYVFDSASISSDTGTATAPGPLIDENYLGSSCSATVCLPIFKRARRCSDGIEVALWKRADTIATNPAVYRHAGVCYVFDNANTIIQAARPDSGPVMTGETYLGTSCLADCALYAQAKECGPSGAAANLWKKVGEAAIPYTFKTSQGCFVIDATSRLSETPGTLVAGEIPVPEGCGRAACAKYVQARSAANGEYVGLWKLLADIPRKYRGTTVAYYYRESGCVWFDVLDPQADTPGTLITGETYIGDALDFLTFGCRRPIISIPSIALESFGITPGSSYTRADDSTPASVWQRTQPLDALVIPLTSLESFDGVTIYTTSTGNDSGFRQIPNALSQLGQAGPQLGAGVEISLAALPLRAEPFRTWQLTISTKFIKNGVLTKEPLSTWYRNADPSSVDPRGTYVISQQRPNSYATGPATIIVS